MRCPAVECFALTHKTSNQMESNSQCSQNTPTISIPGVSRLYEHSYSVKMKIFWAIIIVSCITGCFYQIVDRVSHYLSTPVGTTIDIVRMQTVDFPAFTICSAQLHQALWERTTTEYPDMAANDIWKFYDLSRDNITTSVPCWSSVDGDDCDDDMLVPFHHVDKKHIDTAWGSCIILIPNKPIEYRGPFTRILIKLSGVSQGDPNSTNQRITVFLHSPNAAIRHDAFFYADFISLNHRHTVCLTSKEFRFLNTNKNKCISEEEARSCRDDCIDGKLEDNLTCKLPFMTNSGLPICSDWESTRTAYNASIQVYSDLKVEDCECPRICHEKVYTITIDDKGLYENQTLISLYYSDNYHEIITERYVYVFSALISDIGGNLGLFLGACILTLMEIMETILRQVWMLQKKRKK